MPIYEYYCKRCNRIYSFLFATMSDEDAPTCPRCGATNLERVISLFAFVRGGKDPLAAIPKTEEPGGPEAAEGSQAGDSQSGPPERDPGLYRQAWSGRTTRRRRKLG